MKLSTQLYDSNLINHAALLSIRHARLTNRYAIYHLKKKYKKIAKKPSSRKGCLTRPRIRKSVKQIYNELGRNMFRRAYRMHIETFWELYKKIKSDLWIACKYNSSRTNVPNGRIHPTVRLACALRMFAGGEAVDIACIYGISKTEVHDSLTYVVEVVNKNEGLKIKFPSDHNDQKEIAEGFKNLSKANIDICCGCIDGMLVWMHKPTEHQCEISKVGSKKYFCGRKKNSV